MFTKRTIIFLFFTISLFFTGLHLNIFIQDYINNDMSIINIFSLIFGVFVSLTFGILYKKGNVIDNRKK